MKTTVTLLMLLILSPLNTFAQDYTQFSLPEGAKARLGKGSMHEDMVYSQDGTRLVISSSIGVWLYDTVTSQEVALLAGDWINGFAFSPDGRTLAIMIAGNNIYLWDAKTGAHIRTLRGHTAGVRTVAFSPDGLTLASGGYDDTVRLWDAKTGAHIRTLRGHTKSVTTVLFSPDGRTIASAGQEPTLRLWDAVTGAHKRTLTGPQAEFRKRRVQSRWKNASQWRRVPNHLSMEFEWRSATRAPRAYEYSHEFNVQPRWKEASQWEF